jgi:thiol-disulfide isomerase/thioredoxin
MSLRWLLLLVILLSAGCGDTETASESRSVGIQVSGGMDAAGDILNELASFESFDFDFALQSVGGEIVSLADYQGKVVIVDFWGTWCGPCRQAIPHLGDIYQKYHERGLEVVGINYERGDQSTWSPLIKDFLEKRSVPYTCLLGDEVTKSKVPDFVGYPTMLFIDASGKVRLKTVGARPYAQMEAVVEVLMKERAGGQG